MTKKCKSIYDLAEITGVSYATVSRVLNNRGRTSESTRRKVLETAAKYKFKPKMKARKKTVGILVNFERVLNDNKHGYVDTMLIMLLNSLAVRGYGIEMFTPDNLDSLKNSLLDGLVLLCWNDAVSEILKHMINLPVVAINSPSILGSSRVYSDHEQSGRMAAEFLIENGHKTAGIILDSRNWGNEQRLKGFCEAYAAKGIPLNNSLSGFLQEQSDLILARKIMSQNPSAVFLAGEDSIIPLSNTLRLLTEITNTELTLISMEHPSISRFINPPMTTVAQPFEQIVGKVIEILNEKIESCDGEPVEFCLDNMLIKR